MKMSLDNHEDKTVVIFWGRAVVEIVLLAESIISWFVTSWYSRPEKRRGQDIVTLHIFFFTTCKFAQNITSYTT